MNIDLKLNETTPLQAVKDLMGQHGKLPVLWAVLKAAFNGPKGRVNLPHLDNHLRRDIGLDPLPPDPMPEHLRRDNGLFPVVKIGGLDVWRL